MEIAKLKLSKIKPYAKNPRKNDGAVDAVAESIRQCGYCAPIVVDEDYVILAGYGWPDEAEDDSDHDPCLYGWVDGAAHSWYANRKQTTVLTFDKPRKNAEHPTMKPVPLFGYLIQNSSKPGDVVLDTFAGSGTTIIACEQLKRAAFCCELDPKYCDVIINRWETFTGEKAVLLNG